MVVLPSLSVKPRFFMTTEDHHSPVLDRFAAQEAIEAAWADRTLLDQAETQTAIEHVIEDLDKGKLRVAEPPTEEGGQWTINEWVKKAVILYFPIRQMATQEVGPFEFHDKMALKTDYAGQATPTSAPTWAKARWWIPGPL
jgi:2,3,4,5-tetrahydropyridine-2-carboxylate N-succinyltransferase